MKFYNSISFLIATYAHPNLQPGGEPFGVAKPLQVTLALETEIDTFSTAWLCSNVGICPWGVLYPNDKQTSGRLIVAE